MIKEDVVYVYVCVCVLCVCVCVHVMEYYSDIKKNEIMLFAATRDSHTKRSKSDRHIWYHLYVESEMWHKGTNL